jgi:hypothetical protein
MSIKLQIFTEITTTLFSNFSDFFNFCNIFV